MPLFATPRPDAWTDPPGWGRSALALSVLAHAAGVGALLLVGQATPQPLPEPPVIAVELVAETPSGESIAAAGGASGETPVPAAAADPVPEAASEPPPVPQVAAADPTPPDPPPTEPAVEPEPRVEPLAVPLPDPLPDPPPTPQVAAVPEPVATPVAADTPTQRHPVPAEAEPPPLPEPEVADNAPPPPPRRKPVPPAARPASHPSAVPGDGPPAADTAAAAATPGPAAAPAPAPAPIQASAAEMTVYLAELRRRLQAALAVPDEARRMRLGGSVLVRFRVQVDGRVDEGTLAILRPAALDSLNLGALDAVRRAAPFPPPPAGAAVIEVPVTFVIR